MKKLFLTIFKFLKDLIKYILKPLLQIQYRLKYSKYNKIGKGVKFSKDTFLGRNCRIGDNVILGEKVVISNNVVIGKGCEIERMYIGDNSVIEGRVIITGTRKGIIKIGKESFVGHNTVLDHSDNITIGDYVHIGYSHFWTHSSALQAINGIQLANKDVKYRPTAPIVIEDNVYIGVHSTIYPGIHIAHHSIIAPNSAVNKDVEPYKMVGGVPAKLIKDLD